MALTIQGVIDDVSLQLRKFLDGTGGSGDDFTLIQRWVDQTHKDLLHSSVFSHMLRRRTTVSSLSGTISYTLTPTDIFRVDAVFNRKTNTFLSPLEDIFPPANISDPQTRVGPRPPREISTYRADSPYPQYYRVETTVTSGTDAHTLILVPAPIDTTHAGTLDVFYTRQISSITGASTALEVGEDGRTAMVAGVLTIAYEYLGMNVIAQYWAQKFEALKKGVLV